MRGLIKYSKSIFKKMKANLKVILWLFAASIIFTTSCRKSESVSSTQNLVSNHGHDVVYGWNELFLIIDKDANGFRPGPGPKALAYIGLAAYETAVPGMPSFKSIKNIWGSELKIPNFDNNQEIHWPTALNASYYYMFKKYFEKTEFVTGAGHLTRDDVHRLIENLNTKNETEYAAEINSVVFNNSKAWGQSVASAVQAWAKTDLGYEGELNPLNNDPSKPMYYDFKKEFYDANGNLKRPGMWQPTNDNPDAGMFPRWGETRTFATSNEQKLCKAPIPYSNDPKSPYYAQVLEVYNSCNRSMPYEWRWMAEFWSDDITGLTFSPPSRLLAIMDQILVLKSSNLEKAVEGAVKMGLALNDFGVACWHSKWHWKVERPENFIKREIDPNWEPLLVNPINGSIGITPAFPAYPSGHSTFGGGGATILADLFGNNTRFTDNCHKDRSEFIGTPRTFNSFKQAGGEDAFSRVYLGVHFRMDCETAIEFGENIAIRVLELPWKK